MELLGSLPLGRKSRVGSFGFLDDLIERNLLVEEQIGQAGGVVGAEHAVDARAAQV